MQNIVLASHIYRETTNKSPHYIHTHTHHIDLQDGSHRTPPAGADALWDEPEREEITV